ncbi:hypothetical protein P3S68_019715 [Capsicum galapagoense]
MDEFGGEVEITRRSDNHHPSVWGDHFLAYADLSGANEWLEKEHEDLKEKLTILKMRLRNQCNIYNSYEEWIGEIDESDLHVVALSFRLLRQQGFYVSSDVFRKFTNDQGNYNKALIRDIHGLLCLYEAGHFRVHHEKILDEAVNITTTHLKIMLPKLSNSLSMQINNALKYPINKAVARIATRKYISFYQKDKSSDQVLLNFATLDFNILQKMHKRELCDITRWKILTKAFCFASITDDIYDTCGKLYELTLLTNAIERWNIDAAQELPSYMKLYYTALLDVYTEAEKDLAKENKSFRVNYAILALIFKEAKWYHGKKVPTMEEYMKNGIQSSSIPYLCTASLLGMGIEATEEAYDWIANEPPILIASAITGRLSNDIVSHEREVERGDVTGVQCYMNEYGVTKKEANVEIKKIILNCWKDLNRQCLKPGFESTMPKTYASTKVFAHASAQPC